MNRDLFRGAGKMIRIFFTLICMLLIANDLEAHDSEPWFSSANQAFSSNRTLTLHCDGAYKTLFVEVTTREKKSGIDWPESFKGNVILIFDGSAHLVTADYAENDAETMVAPKIKNVSAELMDLLQSSKELEIISLGNRTLISLLKSREAISSACR